MLLFGCSVFRTDTFAQEPTDVSPTFQDDLTFLKTHTPIVVLHDADAAIAVAPDYQGRVMSSILTTMAHRRLTHRHLGRSMNLKHRLRLPL